MHHSERERMNDSSRLRAVIQIQRIIPQAREEHPRLWIELYIIQCIGCVIFDTVQVGKPSRCSPGRSCEHQNGLCYDDRFISLPVIWIAMLDLLHTHKESSELQQFDNSLT